MEFHHPETVKKASSLLRKKSSLVVAGGTSFNTQPRVEHLVDITRLGLSYIKEKKTKIVIGATSTVTEIAESKTLASLASGILHAASAKMADTQLRNVITVGGNIACKYIWSDLTPALMVLDSKLKINGRQDLISIEEFLKTSLSREEFITDIIVPKKSNKGRGTFIKFNRTSVDYGLINVAAYGRLWGGKVKTLKVAVSGIMISTRIKAIEDELQGKEVNSNMIAEAASKVSAEIPIISSYLFSEDYQRNLLATLLNRAISNVLTE